MQLGTDRAKAEIKYLMSCGFKRKHAIIITKSDSHKEKEYFKCIFEHKVIFPNYQIGEGHRGRYRLNFDFTVSILEREGIKHYTGNVAPRGGQLGKFIAIDEKVYNKVLAKDPKYFSE